MSMIPNTFRRLTSRQRLVLAIASGTLALSVASIGAYANFTATATQTQTVSTATVTLTLGATGSVTNRMNVDATGLFPGDIYYRSVDVTNGGTDVLSAITMTTTASPSSLLDTDTTNGLQMVWQKCSVAWTEAGTSPNFTYTCGGTTSSVLASRPVIGATLALSNLGALGVGITDHLLLTMTFPSSAGNTFQGLSSTITFTLDGVQ